MCGAIDVPFIEWGMASYQLRQPNAIRRQMRPLCMIPNLAGAWSILMPEDDDRHGKLHSTPLLILSCTVLSTFDDLCN